jgi:hypothetical protein
MRGGACNRGPVVAAPPLDLRPLAAAHRRLRPGIRYHQPAQDAAALSTARDSRRGASRIGQEGRSLIYPARSRPASSPTSWRCRAVPQIPAALKGRNPNDEMLREVGEVPEREVPGTYPHQGSKAVSTRVSDHRRRAKRALRSAIRQGRSRHSIPSDLEIGQLPVGQLPWATTWSSSPSSRRGNRRGGTSASTTMRRSVTPRESPHCGDN